MMEKISVRGKDIHPLYEWLTSKEKRCNGFTGERNFQKYLIDEEGNLVDVFIQRKARFGKGHFLAEIR